MQIVNYYPSNNDNDNDDDDSFKRSEDTYVSLCVCVYLCNISKQKIVQEPRNEGIIVEFRKCAKWNLSNFRVKLNFYKPINLCWKYFVSIEYQFIDLIDYFVNRWCRQYFFLFTQYTEIIFFLQLALPSLLLWSLWVVVN